jgi:YVTN family beta-propeller protein
MAVADLTKRIRYYVTNQSSNTLSVIDGFTNNVIKTYAVGDGPKEVINTEDGAVYVASGDNDTVTMIFSDGNTKVLNIPNEGYIAVDIIMGRMYTANRAELQVYDIASGNLVVSISGLSSPQYMTLNKGRNRLFIADGNTIKVYSTITLEHINTINLPGKANYIAISSEDTKAYISYGAAPESAGIQFYDLKNSSAITNITDELLVEPMGLAQRNNILYVVNNTSQGTVVAVDTTTYSILQRVAAVGDHPMRVALSPDNTKLYVANSQGGNISIVDILSNTVDIVSLGEAQRLFAIAGCYAGSTVSPGEPIDFSDSYQLHDIKESVCVMAKKVFAHCQQRICFPIVSIPLPSNIGKVALQKMTFENGSIITGTLSVMALPDRPNFSRVQFILSVPYKAVLKLANEETLTINGVLPEIVKDIVMYRPQTRDEFNFETLIETRAETLSTPNITTESITIAVGVFVVIKVVGEVQLLIPAFGYCPEPPACEDYEEPEEEDICQIFLDFNQTPFPEDFFPASI